MYSLPITISISDQIVHIISTQYKKQNQINKEGSLAKFIKAKLSHNTTGKKVVAIGDYMFKYLKIDNFSSCGNIVEVSIQSGAITEDMLDYIKLLASKKSDTVVIHTGINDMANGVTTISKVRKLGQCVREIDKE